MQGAEKSKVIPHNKIEKLLKEFGFNTVFLRPAYFYAEPHNNTSSGYQNERTIVLPAGKADLIGLMWKILAKWQPLYLIVSLNTTNKVLISPEKKCFFQEVVDLINTQIDDRYVIIM